MNYVARIRDVGGCIGDKNFGDKNFGDKNFGDKNFRDKNFGDKNFGDKNLEIRDWDWGWLWCYLPCIYRDRGLIGVEEECAESKMQK